MTRPDEHPDYLIHPFAQPPVFGEPSSGKSRPTTIAPVLEGEARTAEEVRHEVEQTDPHLAAQRQTRTKG